MINDLNLSRISIEISKKIFKNIIKPRPHRIPEQLLKHGRIKIQG